MAISEIMNIHERFCRFIQLILEHSCEITQLSKYIRALQIGQAKNIKSRKMIDSNEDLQKIDGHITGLGQEIKSTADKIRYCVEQIHVYHNLAEIQRDTFISALKKNPYIHEIIIKSLSFKNIPKYLDDHFWHFFLNEYASCFQFKSRALLTRIGEIFKMIKHKKLPFEFWIFFLDIKKFSEHIDAHRELFYPGQDQLLSDLRIHSLSYPEQDQSLSDLRIHSLSYPERDQLLSDLRIHSLSYPEQDQSLSDLRIHSLSYPEQDQLFSYPEQDLSLSSYKIGNLDNNICQQLFFQF
jgi:hypothetical protein